MKKKNLSCQFLLLASILVFNSCSKSHEDFDSKSQTTTVNNSVIAYIKELGYQDSDIKDLGDDYLVDGDLLFSKNVPIQSTIGNSNARVSQNGGSYYVTPSISTAIIYIDPSMNAYISEVNAAVAQWNAIANTRLHFSTTTNAAAPRNIKIIATPMASCGEAYFPVNGLPGSQIKVNSNQFPGTSSIQRQRTIAHEIGHAVGIMHTELTPGLVTSDGNSPAAPAIVVNIPGTPAADPNSLMNGGQCNTGATVLSAYDKLAFQYLYSAPMPPMSISGKRYVCSSNVYEISGLPSGASVTWSIPASAGSNLQLTQNAPSANKLTITHMNLPYGLTTTLTAVVTFGSNAPVTYTMLIGNSSPYLNAPFTQGACTYNGVAHPYLSGNALYNAVTYVHSGCTVSVDLTGRNATVGAGGTPTFFYKVGTVLLFTLPVDNQNQSFVFNITPYANDGSCSTTLTFKAYQNNQ